MCQALGWCREFEVESYILSNSYELSLYGEKDLQLVLC